MKRRCGNCRFYKEANPPFCWRMPPTSLGVGVSQSPFVAAGSRCGEHSYSLRRLFAPLVEWLRGLTVIRHPHEGELGTVPL